MAVGVIQLLEVVDVKDHQAGRVVVAGMPGKLPLQTAFPVPAIEQAGQTVMQSQLLQLRVGCLQLQLVHRSCSSWLCMRSEEHTSELQSRPHLVCRLLLEKKKKKQ